MKKIINILIIFLPWIIRRYILNKFYHYKIHPTARIGLSYIYPKQLIMGEGARIGHLNVAIHLELIQMDKNCSISQKNWITGFPLSNKSNFQDFPDRKPCLIMKEDSSITKQHHIDCTDMVIVGEFTTIAGYGTQILSHSFSLEKNSQACAPIQIGHHCWVGTRSIILPGSVLPSQSVLGAGAVLQKKYTESFVLYGGVPAKYIKKIDETYEFFHRNYRPK
jgi:acetyltransferase-like isoleucine patch superfamily enzyme